MYEYLIDEIIWSGFFGRVPESDYRDVLAMRAPQGWRLVQVLTIWDQAESLPAAYHLIFERPAKGPSDRTRADEGNEPSEGEQQWPLR